MSQSYAEQYKFGTMQKEIQHKLNNDNDAKVIVVGANSQTGIGKTTFAKQLCETLDQTGEWSAEDKAFIDVQEYLEAYLDYPLGSALLLDEIEHGADNRRAMSQENVNLSQGWATLRARNVLTVATLPSVSMLDKRMIELADYQVFIKKRGLAKPYRIRVNDFKPSGVPSRQPFPNDEYIQFPDLPDDDPDMKYLDKIKDETVRGFGSDIRKIPESEHKSKLKKAKEEARREMRNEAIRSVYDETDLSTTDIAKLDFCNINQSNVSRVINST